MLTEAEAKTKWCPLVRLSACPLIRLSAGGPETVGNVACNRWDADMDLPKNSYCIGSACMAWRYETMPDEDSFSNQVKKTGRGYCGAFGVPT